MSDWKEYKIDEIASILNNKRVPLSSMQRANRKGKFPYYGASGIVDYIDDFIFDGDYVLISEDGENLRSRNTPIAFFAKGKFWVNNHSHIIKGKSDAINKWIIYSLKNLDINPYLTGAVQPKLNKENLLTIPFLLPSSDAELNDIVSILSSLDDKIELNNKINQELESLAQLLYKRWFVDFEFPNKNGEPYKSSGGEMVDTEFGEIPKGWIVDTLENHINIINGFAFKSEDYTNKGCKIIRTKNFNEKGFLDLNDLVFLTETDSKKYSKFNLQLYDKLVVMVGASIGKSVIVTSNILPALQNQNMWNFRAKTREFQAYSNFLTNQLVEQNIGSATGSAREFFRKDFFYSRKILVPNTKVLVSFGDAVFSMYDKLDALLAENKELISLRDTLLPKLISGELQINEN